MTTALVLAAAYLLGSIPFSFLVARWFGVPDVRKVGSGNVGTANVMRSAGKTAGLIAFALDFGKGSAATLLARVVASPEWLAPAAAVVAVIGHMYPVWLSFRGGKGVATGAGACLPLAPAATGLALAAFGVTLALTRISSVSSVTGAFVLAVGCAFLRAAMPVTTAAAGLAVLIAWKHRGNFQRLLRGEEPRIGRGLRTAKRG